MARSTVKAGGIGLRLGIQMDELEQTDQTFKSARRQIVKDLRDVMRGAATDVVLPAARRRAGRLRTKRGSIASSLVVRSGTGNAAYLTTSFRGVQGRVVGLHEFGGTVRAPIRARGRRRGRGGHAPAVMTPYGPRAAVLGPRHYHGQHFMERARDEKLKEFAGDVRDQLVTRFEPLQIR